MKITQAGTSILEIPFVYKEKPGKVKVKLTVNKGIISSGFTAIGDHFTDKDVKGYPVMKGAVSYSGRGYEALFGWVQIVTHAYDGGPEIETEADIAPQFFEYGNPFAFYGYKPVIYDAPKHNPGVTMDWIAYSFLAPLKYQDVTGKKAVAPIVGYKWGYRLVEGKITGLIGLEEVNQEKWRELKSEVEPNYTDWAFLDSFIL